MTHRRAGAIASAAAVALAIALVGCAANPEAEPNGYTSGDGTVSEFDRESRADPIEFAGVDEFGTDRESQDYLGEVLVVNFWYAACPPCRVEAPWLEELSAKYSGEGVSFLGVNVRDSADTAKSFAETFGIGYPSLIDDQGAIALAFAGVASPTAVPTTVVLDKHGRPASRIVGLIDKSVLETLIVSALDEEYE